MALIYIRVARLEGLLAGGPRHNLGGVARDGAGALASCS